LALDTTDLGPHSTDLQRSKILECANSLQRKIDAWSEIQHLYLPAVAMLRCRSDQAGGGHPPAAHELELHLPSKVIPIMNCDWRLVEVEWRFRQAQAESALNELRGQLLIRSRLHNSKNWYSRGQHQQTRSNTVISCVEARVRASASKYRDIRTALLTLSPYTGDDGTWTLMLRPLEDGDVLGLTSMDDLGPEGRKRLSWIWKVHGTGSDADEATQSGESFNINDFMSADF